MAITTLWDEQSWIAAPSPIPIAIVNPQGYDWGNLVIQLLIAAATVAALFWAIRTGRDEARRASEERRERLAFEEKAQAAQVSAWERQWVELRNGRPLPDDPGEFGAVQDDLVERRHIYVMNDSTSAIYDVVVRYFDTSWVREADGGDESDLRGAWFHAILPPEAHPRSLAVRRVPNCGALAEDVVLEVEFRDGAGRHWVRNQDGELVRRRELDQLTVEQRLERRRAEAEREPGFTP